MLNAKIFDRHEYMLTDDAGTRALLVYGSQPGVEDRFLFRMLDPLVPMTPVQAATLHVGDLVNFQDYEAPVSELFQCTIEQMELADVQWPGAQRGDVFYGVAGKSEDTLLLARWNNGSITFFKGDAVSGKEVAAAFKSQGRN